MKGKMEKNYRVLVTWQVNSVIDVKADSFEDAIEKVKNNPLPEGDYIPESETYQDAEEFEE